MSSKNQKLVTDIIAKCMKKKDASALLEFANTSEDAEAGIEVLVTIGQRYLDPKNNNKNTNGVNLSTANHTIAAKIMMICGALLESGAPCAEELTPCFLNRMLVAMKALIANRSGKASKEAAAEQQDILEGLSLMYLPIIAGYSMDPDVRSAKMASEEFRNTLDSIINHFLADVDGNEEQLDDATAELVSNLKELQQMLNIEEGEHVVVIEPNTGLGVIVALSGVSQVGQLHYHLNSLFPTPKKQKSPKRQLDVATWNMWNCNAGENLSTSEMNGEETYSMSSMPIINRCFISQEATIDEIPKVISDRQPPLRVILLAPSLYVRPVDPAGLFHLMEADVEVVKELKTNEVRAWLKACVDYATIENPLSEEENAQNPKRPYGWNQSTEAKKLPTASKKKTETKPKSKRKIDGGPRPVRKSSAPEKIKKTTTTSTTKTTMKTKKKQAKTATVTKKKIAKK